MSDYRDDSLGFRVTEKEADRTIEGIVLLNLLEQRVHELYKRRGWYQAHVGWIPAQRSEDMAELRYLVGVLRRARDVARPTFGRRDPMTVARGEYPADYHDWQSAP